jgi:hypothetical protein
MISNLQPESLNLSKIQISKRLHTHTTGEKARAVLEHAGNVTTTPASCFQDRSKVWSAKARA